MNRTQRRRLRLKRRLTFAYTASSVLTLGILAIIVYVALQQDAWTLSWFGLWLFFVHQLVALAVHVFSMLRTHREYEELIRQYGESSGSR